MRDEASAYAWMWVPESPATASAALSREPMMHTRPGRDLANFTAARTRAICSSGVSPRAFPPRAITTRLKFFGEGIAVSFLQLPNHGGPVLEGPLGHGDRVGVEHVGQPL